MADKVNKLSEAIRYGSTFIGESKMYAERSEQGQWNCGCAVGTAYLATINAEVADIGGGGAMMTELAARFNVPRHHIENVSYAHFTGRMTRAQCADYLESLGY